MGSYFPLSLLFKSLLSFPYGSLKLGQDSCHSIQLVAAADHPPLSKVALLGDSHNGVHSTARSGSSKSSPPNSSCFGYLNQEWTRTSSWHSRPWSSSASELPQQKALSWCLFFTPSSRENTHPMFWSVNPSGLIGGRLSKDKSMQ